MEPILLPIGGRLRHVRTERMASVAALGYRYPFEDFKAIP
jgi:hypothetical protein